MTTTRFRRRMSVIIAVLGLAGATAAACGLPNANADEARAPTPLRCEIQLTETAGSTLIEGHVQARAPASGRYELNITTRSRAGSSTIQQSGEFALAEGAATTLGQTRLSGPSSQIAAEMTLHSRGRNVTCAQARL